MYMYTCVDNDTEILMKILTLFRYSEATIESEMQYMLQPSRIYVGDNINVFQKG